MIKINFYKIASILCALLLAAATIFVLMRWSQIPDQIPTHYNFASEPDRYGGKGSLILMMALAWVVFFTITISVRYPDKWNMPVEVTEENRSRLYAITRAMMEVIKILTVALFILLFTTAAANITMPAWPMIAIVVAILVTVVIAIVMMRRNK